MWWRISKPASVAKAVSAARAASSVGGFAAGALAVPEGWGMEFAGYSAMPAGFPRKSGAGHYGDNKHKRLEPVGASIMHHTSILRFGLILVAALVLLAGLVTAAIFLSRPQAQALPEEPDKPVDRKSVV